MIIGAYVFHFTAEAGETFQPWATHWQHGSRWQDVSGPAHISKLARVCKQAKSLRYRNIIPRLLPIQPFLITVTAYIS